VAAEMRGIDEVLAGAARTVNPPLGAPGPAASDASAGWPAQAARRTLR
jgi:hypothetical protein